MKLNLELNIDWINEDESLSEVVEQEIKNKIVSKIVSQYHQSIMADVKKEMDKFFAKSIDNTMKELLDEYLEKPIVVGDGYKTESFDSALDMIRQKFSSLYNAEFRKSNSCNSDPLYKKLQEQIRYEASSAISETKRIIEQEGKKLAQEEIEKNTLIQALKEFDFKKNK